MNKGQLLFGETIAVGLGNDVSNYFQESLNQATSRILSPFRSRPKTNPLFHHLLTGSPLYKRKTLNDLG